MGFARTSITGVTRLVVDRAFNGYTLFTPLNSKETVLIDMKGRVVYRWSMPYPPALHGELLSNGNLLYAGRVENGPLADSKGAGGELVEVDWNSNLVWSYKDPYMHHSFHRMPNGNTLILRWVKVPGELAVRVKGGLYGTERNGTMWSDCVQEVAPSGKVIWNWLAHEHLDPDTDVICPLCTRSQWTEANSLAVLPDGNILISFLRTNSLCIVEKTTGKIKWRWGAEELSHQNSVSVLRSGNILLFDNGVHAKGISVGYSRILEIDPNNSMMVWEYKDNPWTDFYSAYMSSCQRLPNSNTLICEAQTGRISEVTQKGELIWEYVSPFHFWDSVYGHTRGIPRAYRYGADYEGLKGKRLRNYVPE